MSTKLHANWFMNGSVNIAHKKMRMQMFDATTGVMGIAETHEERTAGNVVFFSCPVNE